MRAAVAEDVESVEFVIRETAWASDCHRLLNGRAVDVVSAVNADGCAGVKEVAVAARVSGADIL